MRTNAEWSNAEWIKNILLLKIPTGCPPFYPVLPRHTPEKHATTTVVSQGEVKGHRHRKHIVILSGKLRAVSRRRSLIENKQKKIVKVKEKHTEVQVKNNELLR